jgi:hypothetical protein
MSTTRTIPPLQELREQIAARLDEIRALRQLLKLAVAADEAEAARARQRTLDELAPRAKPIGGAA